MGCIWIIPLTGSRMLKGLLLGEGYNVGGLQVRNLMKRMGIQAMYRRPNTSKPAPSHKIYPYLFLSKLPVMRPNQVSLTGMNIPYRAIGPWITYIPMKRGFVYLAAVIGWFTRRVLFWRLSITLELGFCIEYCVRFLE